MLRPLRRSAIPLRGISNLRQTPKSDILSRAPYQWPDQSSSVQNEAEQRRYETVMRVSATAQGILLLLTLGGAATMYLEWPSVKQKFLRALGLAPRINADFLDKNQTKLIKSREKSLLRSIPCVPNTQKSFQEPGIYLWGSKNLSLFPKRITIMDDLKFRDICLIDDSETNLAIDDHGNLIKWTSNAFEKIIPDQDLVTVKYSNKCAYALTRKGRMLIVPLENDRYLEYMTTCRSKILPWRHYAQYSLILDTQNCFKNKGESKIVDYDVGADHLVILSNVHKAYGCATGDSSHEREKRSHGQFGIPKWSHFNNLPSANQLTEIELLNNNMKTNEGRLAKRQIKKVACGLYHTLGIDSDGEVYGFGWNKNGQLGIPITYETEHIPIPKLIDVFKPFLSSPKNGWKCVDVHCSGNTSYATFANSNNPTELKYFAFGYGLNGELGNGQFRNSQNEPTAIKMNTDSKKIKDWSVGEDHVLCVLEDGCVLGWGNNSKGLLANGKRRNISKPSPIPAMVEPGCKVTDLGSFYDSKLILDPRQRIATSGISACIYWT